MSTLSASLEAACSDADKLREQLRSSSFSNTLDSALSARGAEETTPLMVAAKHGDAECVAELVAAGADVRAVDKFGRNALHHATANRKDDPAVAALLLVADEQSDGPAELASVPTLAGVLATTMAENNDSPRVGQLLENAAADPEAALAPHRVDLAAKTAAWGQQVAKQEREAAANALGKADKELPDGTAICVAGHGYGTYKSFTQRFLGPNEHAIVFGEDGDAEDGVVISLKDEHWTVYESEFNAMAARRKAGPPRNWRMCCSTGIPEGVPPAGVRIDGDEEEVDEFQTPPQPQPEPEPEVKAEAEVGRRTTSVLRPEAPDSLPRSPAVDTARGSPPPPPHDHASPPQFGEATVHEVAVETAPEPAPDADAATTVSAAGADYVPASPLEAKIAEMIKGITAGRESKPKFVKIQLQFPKVAAVFDTVKSTFKEIDIDGSGTIELSEMTGALAKVRMPHGAATWDGGSVFISLPPPPRETHPLHRCQSTSV